MTENESGTPRYWLGVVSAAHVRRGVELGIAQINHGKRAALAKMKAGDTLIYYSPTVERGDGVPYQHFTAVGTIADNNIWQADESDFQPYRRRVTYESATPVAVADLRGELHLTSEPNWGYKLRFGLIELDEHDATVIRRALTESST